MFGCAPEGDICESVYTECAESGSPCFSLSDECDSDDDSCFALVGRCTDAHSACYSLWEQVHLAALIPAFISIVCSLYIICCTVKYRRQFKQMTFGAMLPMFISICDVGFHSFHGIDHVHNLSTGFVTEGPWCKVLGATAILFMLSQNKVIISSANTNVTCLKCLKITKFFENHLVGSMEPLSFRVCSQ